jgi:hypothetical protein
LGKARAAKLNIHNWSTAERLRLLTAGRFLQELWNDSLVLAPFQPRAGKAPAPTMTRPEEAVTGHLQIGVVEHKGEDTFLDECIRNQRALDKLPEKWARLGDPDSREGQAIHARIANNLVGKAAAQVATEVRGTVNDQDMARLLSLHPPARNMQHRAAGQEHHHIRM